MVGHLQRSDAAANRSLRRVRAEASQAAGPALDEATVAPPLPLDASEAELCERLRGAMEKAVKRVPLAMTPPLEIPLKPPATPAEAVAAPQPLPPLPDLPMGEAPAAAPVFRRAAWVQRSRRQRLSAALRAAPAWMITVAIIMATLAGAAMMTAGVERSLDLAQRISGSAAGVAELIRGTFGH